MQPKAGLPRRRPRADAVRTPFRRWKGGRRPRHACRRHRRARRDGEVRLKVFSDDLSAYKTFNGGALTLKSTRHGGNGTIARIAEVTDRNAAEAMRGTELTVPRSALPPLADGEYYHADLLGLPAVSTDGAVLGIVVAIDDFGAGDVIEIERPARDGMGGRRFMVPMNADAVPEWDGDRIVVSANFVTA